MPGYRTKEDHSMHKGAEIRCSCGNLIGIVEKKWIKMKQNTFEFSGTVTKR
ncbi:MAG: hypothetical protein U9N08_07930 [Candidatus Caldatribacteriota bacterium]|nr:hypothetical protein [Candidatus Caldatribacteriota bacterium]